MNLKLLAFALTTLVLILSCNQRSDKDIETDISVNVHPTAPDITIGAYQGVVTLSGMIKDSTNWKTTLEVVKATPGVKKVVDKLHIRLPKPALNPL